MISHCDDDIVVVMSEDHVRCGVAEYLGLEETTRPQELVWGYVRDAPSPEPRHQNAVLDFAIAWRAHVQEKKLGVVNDRIVSTLWPDFDRSCASILTPLY